MFARHLLIGAFCLVSNHAALAADCTLPHVSADGSFEYSFLDKNGQPATGWRITTSISAASGLVIEEAHFRVSAAEPWIQVLADARVSEIFVPYHSGDPRFYDTNYFRLLALSQDELGACGQLIPGGASYIAMELRDHGILWKQDSRFFRGSGVTLWSAMHAGNYNYLISYSFADDGTVELRAAGTSQNLPFSELEAHTHTVLWRIDMDVAGADSDTVYIRRHLEPSGSLEAEDRLDKANAGKEGPLAFKDAEYNELRVIDSKAENANALGHLASYDIRPVRRGAARHHGAGEDFAQHDAWVLRSKPSETLVRGLPGYANQESVVDSDIVVWIQSPLHHEPRDEDGYYRNANWFGVALAMWGGVDLRPRNIFAGTPYYP